MARKSILIVAIVLAICVGLVGGYVLWGRGQEESPQASSEEWVTWVDQTIVVSPASRQYLELTGESRVISVKCSVESTSRVDLYWKSSRDVTTYKPDISVENVLQYNSHEMQMLGSDVLAIINRGPELATVKIFIEIKI
jgi:hypothetical protein